GMQVAQQLPCRRWDRPEHENALPGIAGKQLPRARRDRELGERAPMKPNDANGRLPTAERPLRVLLVAGSDRRQYNCPGVDSKARTLVLRMADRLPAEWEIDYEDLANVYGRPRIQSCNAC